MVSWGRSGIYPFELSAESGLQVNFGEEKFTLCGEPSTAQLFCLRLGYSKQPRVMELSGSVAEEFLGEAYARWWIG